jgi:hypothetical protein
MMIAVQKGAVSVAVATTISEVKVPLMRCGTSRSSEITSDWDTLLTRRTEERARLPRRASVVQSDV